MASPFSTIMRPLLTAASRATPRRAAYATKAKAAIASSATEQVFPRPGFYEVMLDYKLPPQNHTGRREPVQPPATPEPAPPEEKPPSTEAPGKPTKARTRKRKTDGPAAKASPEPAPAPQEPAPAKASQAKTKAAAAEEEKTPEQKAKIVFGSTLAGPARRAELRAKGTLVAGLLVPPKPEEPDNCCMSGCVNCVWEQYREEMEEWVATSSEAERRMMARRGKQGQEASARPDEMSIDEDGGGSEANWPVEPERLTKDLWDESLYKDIPVGIREFMKQEKRLKERHAAAGTSSG